MQNQIPNNFQKVKVSGVADIYLGGTPSKAVPDYWDGNVKWLSIQDIANAGGPYIRNSAATITQSGVKNSAAKIMPVGTAVISARGTVGEMGILAEPMAFNQSCYGLLPKDESTLDKTFLFYSLKHQVENAKRLAHGGVFNTFTKATFDHIEIPFPEKNKQKKITEILSVLDDKIEMNNKIAKTLEEMSQAIFKEWFVKSDAPEGKLSDVAEITMGQSPPSRFYNLVGNGLPFHQGVTNFGSRFPKHEVFCTENNRIAETGDLLFSVRAPVGRINIANSKISLGRGVASIRHKKKCQSYLYYLLKRLFKKEDSLGGGSVFPAVTKDDMENMKIIAPKDQIVEKFENMVKDMDKKIELIEKENQKLAALCDLLLPKLMKGEIRV